MASPAPAARRAVLLASIGGALFAASFPPLDIGWLAWLAPALLVQAVRHASRPRAFLLGWLYGSIGTTACVASSLFEASARYFDNAPWLHAGFALALPQLYGAPYFGVFACAARALLVDGRRRAMAAIAIPASWVVCELARARIAQGAPWLLLGQSQHATLPWLQIADITGIYGVAFVIVSASVALVFLRDTLAGTLRPSALARTLALPALLVGATFVYGEVQLRRWRVATGPTIEVALIQGAIPMDWRRSIERAPEALDRLRGLTRDAVRAHADLVVWPENAVGFAVAANEEIFGRIIEELAPQAWLLLGAPRSVPRPPAPDGRSTGVTFRNAAFLLDPHGRVTAHYDKLRLTPYAEYAPWPASLLARPRFGTGTLYTAGTEARLFEVRGTRFATMICYEAIYADLARTFVQAGATFLLNISNDDWFGTRPALVQHFHASLPRAIENRRPLVRVTNTGITAVVDPTGAIVSRAPPRVPTFLTASITPVETQTFYTRHGDVFGWLCVVVTGLGIVRAGRPGGPAAISRRPGAAI
jgi:apolipoprotein N-acyltransferase